MKIKNPSNEKFDIIIVAGQSNASGCGRGKSSTPWIVDERILMFNEDYTADVVKTPYGDMIGVKSTGDCYINIADERGEGEERTAAFCLSFAKKYAEKNLEKGRKLLLVQTAIGGTGFAKNHWGENQILEKRLYEMTDAALSMNKENRIVGVLWHQGEHDIFENANFNYQQRFDFYKGKLTVFIIRLREKYGENIPFLSGGFCSLWLKTQKEENVRAINDAIMAVKEQFSMYEHVSETLDLKSNKEVCGINDNVHFCRDASYELGRRYYEKFDKLRKENK